MKLFLDTAHLADIDTAYSILESLTTDPTFAGRGEGPDQRGSQ